MRHNSGLSWELSFGERDITARPLKEIGLSLGSVNFILKELIKKGYVKAQRSQELKQQGGIHIRLTPKGINEALRQTQYFLVSKMEEYEKLQREIDDLRQENALLDENVTGTDGRRPAIFIDRDGTIMVDVGYPKLRPAGQPDYRGCQGIERI
jgi:hypothetical protein